MKKIFSYAIAFVLMVFLSPDYVQAAEFRVAENDGNIVVSQEEKVKNLYAGGNLVSVDADVEKGLSVGGNFITIKGNVENNLMAGGGTVMIRGDVGGTAYVGGGNVIIEGTVTDDLFVGGGTVTIAETAYVGGDLIVGGGVVNIYGPVEGNVLLGAGQATIDSKVGGQVKAEVETLNLGDNARVVGDLIYRSPEEAVMADRATVLGEVKFDQISARQEVVPSKYSKVQKPAMVKMISLGLLMKLVVTLTTALALIYFFKKSVGKVVHESLTNFWPSFGTGFATLVLTPMLGLILVMTLIGAGLAGLMMMLYVLMILLASPLASISLGSWLVKSYKKSSEYLVDWKSTVLGVVVMALIALIPPIGWLTSFVFTMISLGSLCQLFLKGVKIKK